MWPSAAALFRCLDSRFMAGVWTVDLWLVVNRQDIDWFQKIVSVDQSSMDKAMLRIYPGHCSGTAVLYRVSE
jgi:hypothetical protein